MEEKEFKMCEDCGTDKRKLYKYVEREQEYPGAHVWTYTYYLCSKCRKARGPQAGFVIQENKRGW